MHAEPLAYPACSFPRTDWRRQGLLPPRLRDEYGLRWSLLHELALPLAARSLRLATTPALIASSRFAPLPRELAA